MNIGKRMKDRRKQLGLTADQVAEKLNVSRASIFRYEKGDIEKFPLDSLMPLAEALQTTPEELMGWQSEADISIIYNQLNDLRQTKVYNFAEHQLKEQNQVRLYGSVAANPEALAYADDTYHDDYVTKDVPKNADGALVVAGNSMEPDYKNGSIVFYKKQFNVENGELAVVDVDGDGATFKQVMFDYDSEKIILKSLNKDYPNREIEGNRVRIIGKVLN